MVKIQTIDLKLETKGVESKVINLTVRNCFYHGVIGKLKCLLYWVIHRDNKSFKDYLMSPVTYTTEIGNIYCSCDINYIKIKNKRVIKVEVPKVIWDAEMSIFNFRPILSTWMESIRNVVKQVKEEK